MIQLLPLGLAWQYIIDYCGVLYIQLHWLPNLQDHVFIEKRNKVYCLYTPVTYI